MAGKTRTDLYRAIGGTSGCRKLSAAFYARVDRDPVLRPLFPGKTLKCAIEEFAAFLVQFLGGPGEDAQRRWWVSLRDSHLRFSIGGEQRNAWMSLMAKALDDAQIGEPARSALLGFFELASAHVVNRGPTPPVSEDHLHPEIAERWNAQRALDEAVAAIRRGDADRAIALGRHCASPPGILALMIGSGHGALLDYVQETLTRDPALVHTRYAGRTLLHTASGAGSLATVESLLRLGADPNATDGGGHTPLYCAGNECKSGGGEVVRALVRGGANVNANGGVKRCTALHVAARRGNVEVAAALLDCGADIEARDTHGDTPLRRAVNCRKTGVVSLLLSRGATYTC
jgi:hemoglobin